MFLIIGEWLTGNRIEKPANRVFQFSYGSGFGRTEIFGSVTVRNFFEPKNQ